MKILTSDQVRFVDQYTIKYTPISSIDLMEQAAEACFKWILQNIDKKHFIFIFCGPGNNGGDGLAIARKMHNEGYSIKAILINTTGKLSVDYKTNLERLKAIDKQLVEELATSPDSLTFQPDSIIIDAIFGTGLSRTVDQEYGKFISKINASKLQVISIDLPSGIYSDRSTFLTGNEIIKACTTLTFQFLKPAFLVAENDPFFGKVEVLEIGLLDEASDKLEIKTFLTDQSMVRSIYKPKRLFSHKGNFGHSLLISGSTGKMGAAILAALSYLKSGAGLLTMMVPKSEMHIIQIGVPEAMAIGFEEPLESFYSKFDVVGAGPGLGTESLSVVIIQNLLKLKPLKLVLDADALNILSSNPEWFNLLPEGTILTPHPGEFKRMAGTWSNDFEKLEKQREFTEKYKVYIVLKGKYTSISCPDGTIYFNPTGNAGMAKGGSGDSLTGIITGLVASGYDQKEACILGVYLHGLAGDIAKGELTEEAMNARDLVERISKAWMLISHHNRN